MVHRVPKGETKTCPKKLAFIPKSLKTFEIHEINPGEVNLIKLVGEIQNGDKIEPLTYICFEPENPEYNIRINLEEEISELKEVVVTAKKWKYRKLGNTTKSQFIGTGFFYNQLGSELGIKINLRKKEFKS
jgi:hypothetical protein